MEDQELQLARHAGQVADAMMNAGRCAIAADIPETIGSYFFGIFIWFLYKLGYILL